ncbi:MAG: DKNYY domain-containing protein, partial [Planctomycetota bacterium]
MSFEVEGGVVRWKGRVVKGADAGTFETLRGPVGADASTVWFGAKAQKVDRATFEVLGTHYAKDANAVFYALETKLKPVKGADASSFEALGSYYGRDAASGYFKERRLKLVKSATGSLDGLREIGAPFATDGGALYHAHQRIQVSNDGYGDAPRELPDIDLGSARLRAFGYNEVNCPALLLDDGRATLWRTDSWRWFDVSGVDFESARELGPDDVWRRRFLSDGSVLFAGGARVEVPEGIEPILVGEDVVEVGDRVLRGAERLDGFGPGELRWLGGQHYQTSGETVTLTPDGDLARRGRPPVPALADALRALVLPASELFASIADRYLPIEATPSDFDYDVSPPGGAVELEVSSATSAIARFRVGDEAFEAPPGALLTQLTSAWALSRGRADRLLVFAGYVWMGPHAHSIQDELARRFPEACGNLVAALFAAGAEDCAALHVQRGVAALERDEEGLAALLARIPFEMAASVRYVPHHHAIDVTTNFAVVKLMAEP